MTDLDPSLFVGSLRSCWLLGKAADSSSHALVDNAASSLSSPYNEGFHQRDYTLNLCGIAIDNETHDLNDHIITAATF
jgi:dipeptide/tripeptide permease